MRWSLLCSLTSAAAPTTAQVVVARTEGGAVCGGYNPKGWIGLGEDRDAIAAFLFTWPDGDTGRRPVKLPKARSTCRRRRQQQRRTYCPACHELNNAYELHARACS